MFDRVIEKERLYGRDLDTHYEKDMEEKSRNTPASFILKIGGKKMMIELEEMLLLQRRQNTMLVEELERVKLSFSKARHEVVFKENVAPVCNPYKTKSIGHHAANALSSQKLQ